MEGSWAPKWLQLFYMRGRASWWQEMELVGGQTQSAVFCTQLRKLSWDCSGSFLSELLFLRAVVLRDGDGHIQMGNSQIFTSIYIFKWQMKISFSSLLFHETEFWAILFMQLPNEQTIRLLHTFVMNRSCGWKRKHYFNLFCQLWIIMHFNWRKGKSTGISTALIKMRCLAMNTEWIIMKHQEWNVTV